MMPIVSTPDSTGFVLSPLKYEKIQLLTSLAMSENLLLRKKDLKVALITDWMVAPGGADRYLLSLLRIFPKATVFTSIYSEQSYIREFKIPADVKTTFLQRLPFKKRLSRHYNLLTPFAFESLDLRGFDLVISFSAGPAKGVITTLKQKYVSIFLTPTRFLWDGNLNARASRLKRLYSSLSPFVATWLRIWDYNAARRADAYVSISKFIQKKVKKSYELDSEVIYPGVSQYWFEPLNQADIKRIEIDLSRRIGWVSEKFFLVVSRLYDYKRVDIAIRAAIKTNKHLLIVGDGPDKKYLQKVANGNPGIVFLGNDSDEIIKYLYSRAEGLLFCGVEDFGYVPVEAMASGTPVLAYDEGGVMETIIDSTGKIFHTESELQQIMSNFSKEDFKREEITVRAQEFSEERFHESLIKFTEKVLDAE